MILDNNMNVSVISIQRFHHFHLARQLHRFKILNSIYSGYPLFALRNEFGIPKQKIITHPYFQLGQILLNKFLPFLPDSFNYAYNNFAHKNLAINVANKFINTNVLIASSRTGLEAGKIIQSKGGYYFCDRGSTHIKFQNKILKEEYRRHKIAFSEIPKSIIDRECEEYETADFISIPSTFVYDSFIKKGFASKKLFLNPYGANINLFNSKNITSKKKFRILFVGHASIRKGIIYLIKAFNKLSYSNKELIIVGGVEKSIKPIIEKLSNNNIKFTGLLKNNTLKKYYSTSDVMVLPSLEEGLAQVIGEALACGCPVIATKNTGAEDFFTNNKEGFIIPIRSDDHILNKLQLLIDDRYLRDKMSNNASLLTKKINGWDQYGDRWVKKIKSLKV